MQSIKIPNTYNYTTFSEGKCVISLEMSKNECTLQLQETIIWKYVCLEMSIEE